jgi:hypothetical protein
MLTTGSAAASKSGSRPQRSATCAAGTGSHAPVPGSTNGTVVGVLVAVSVGVRVGVGVNVAVAVLVCVGVIVGVAVAVSFGIGVGECVGVSGATIGAVEVAVGDDAGRRPPGCLTESPPQAASKKAQATREGMQCQCRMGGIGSCRRAAVSNLLAVLFVGASD